jgi:hypothetical protein
MLSKCANPDCPSSFRYLHEGKLFRVHFDSSETESASTPYIDGDSKKPIRRVEFFWLCKDCSEKMTLHFEKGIGVSIRPVTRTEVMAS